MRKPRAIVCDDDETIQTIFRSIFEKMDYEVFTADTPMTCIYYRDNVDRCPQNHLCSDILITDHSMPGMTGLELLEKQHERGCRLASRNKALITGHVDPELKERTERIGCKFILKPMHISAIMEWIKECEKTFDLSQPLVTDLYLPAKDRLIPVKSAQA